MLWNCHIECEICAPSCLFSYQFDRVKTHGPARWTPNGSKNQQDTNHFGNRFRWHGILFEVKLILALYSYLILWVVCHCRLWLGKVSHLRKLPPPASTSGGQGHRWLWSNTSVVRESASIMLNCNCWGGLWSKGKKIQLRQLWTTIFNVCKITWFQM